MSGIPVLTFIISVADKRMRNIINEIKIGEPSGQAIIDFLEEIVKGKINLINEKDIYYYLSNFFSIINFMEMYVNLYKKIKLCLK